MWRICALRRLILGLKKERELLGFAKEWNIPTIVIFTNTQEKAGDAFVKEAQKVIKMKSGGLAVLSKPM
ncbi:hypothetical protein HpCS18_09150 [Helicobacter pylori]